MKGLLNQFSLEKKTKWTKMVVGLFYWVPHSLSLLSEDHHPQHPETKSLGVVSGLGKA